MTFEKWFVDKYENEPGFEDFDLVVVAKRAWQAANERAVRIYYRFHPCNCSALTTSMKPCLSCRVTQEFLREK